MSTYKKLSARMPSRASTTKQSFSKNMKAAFRLHPCVFQKGDNKGKLTGNMQAAMLPGGPNEEFKAAVRDLLLDAYLQWYPDEKVYKARVHTKKQAEMLLAKMQNMYGEEDLPHNIDEAGEWNPATTRAVSVVPTACVVASPGIEVGDVILNDPGPSDNLFPLKEHLKELGFTFVKDFNNVPRQDFWVAPADKVDLNALAALYDKWGWDATLYAGAE